MFVYIPCFRVDKIKLWFECVHSANDTNANEVSFHSELRKLSAHGKIIESANEQAYEKQLYGWVGVRCKAFVGKLEVLAFPIPTLAKADNSWEHSRNSDNYSLCYAYNEWNLRVCPMCAPHSAISQLHKLFQYLSLEEKTFLHSRTFASD